MAAKKKDNKKKGGEVKKKPAKKLHTLFEVKGDSVTKKNSSCPKCGTGNFMASHKDRKCCGKCAYTEFKK